MGRSPGPRFYRELADWWPLLSAREGYRGEAAACRQTLIEACRTPPRTLLELGCGGGNNAWHLKRDFQLTLVDLSPSMLAVSRRANPECEHLVGDMRGLRLGRVFDAVFIHDAIMYLTTERDLLRAMRTAHDHCRPGGAVVIAPDYVREDFAPRTWHGGHDGSDGRALRYLEWTWDPDPGDTTYRVDMVYVLRDRGQRVRVVRDRHVLGLFAIRVWRTLLRRAGFVPRVVTTPWGREVFVGAKRMVPARPAGP